MAGLSTHILDTSRGMPASAVKIELFIDGKLVTSRSTNADGRTDEPLIKSGDLQPGVHELHFHAGDYFRANNIAVDDVLFLDVVVIRFGINNPQQHYHVPLLLSPFGYSTYRGS